MSRFNSERTPRRASRVATVARLLGTLAGAGLLSSCELDKIAIPKTTPSVVVHLVLNPSAATQVMLLERTLTGAVTVPDTNFDSSNPIATAGGIPVSGAVAEIRDSTGRITRGVEDKITATGVGTGVYRFSFGSTLRTGSKYDLTIQTAEGETVTATTRLPRPVTASPSLTRTFNRDRDTLLIQWSATPGARTYALRVESPFGPFFLFTDSTRFRMTGETRNLFSGEFQRLFFPGFRQAGLVAAVDSNFYDYYRTNNDPFTGAGIISRVNGGLGLFGALVTLTSGTITVTTDIDDPIEGTYRLTPASTDATAPVLITLTF